MTPTLASKKILLVDDEPSLLLILERILRAAGYEVQSARDGLEGLDHFLHASWDLVVVDRAMPQMGGEELAQEIRSRSPQTPIILITGALRLVKSPELFDLLFAKPFSSADFLAGVSRSLNARTEMSKSLS